MNTEGCIFPNKKKKKNEFLKNDSNISKSPTVNGSNEEAFENHFAEPRKEKREDNNREERSNNVRKSSNDKSCTGGSSAWNAESDDEDEEDAFLCKLPIVEVEVWGCGDTKALEEQRIMLQNEETCKNERRSVDKSKIVQNSFDKQFLLPKMFVGKMEEMAPDT